MIWLEFRPWYFSLWKHSPVFSFSLLFYSFCVALQWPPDLLLYMKWRTAYFSPLSAANFSAVPSEQSILSTLLCGSKIIEYWYTYFWTFSSLSWVWVVEAQTVYVFVMCFNAQKASFPFTSFTLFQNWLSYL